jgi:hypothetical protein
MKPPSLYPPVSRNVYYSSQVKLNCLIESRLTIPPHNSLGSTSPPVRFRCSIESRVTLLPQESLPYWSSWAPLMRKTKSAQQAYQSPTRNQSSVVGPPLMKKAHSAKARLLMALPEWGALPSEVGSSCAGDSNRSIKSTLTHHSGKKKTGLTKGPEEQQVTPNTNGPMSLASLSQDLAAFL